jgi:hypothetical protein
MPSLIIRHVTLYRFRQPVAFGDPRRGQAYLGTVLLIVR